MVARQFDLEHDKHVCDSLLAAVEGETLPLEEELAVLEALDELVVLVEGVTLGLFETQMHVYAFGAPHEAEQQSVAVH